MRSALSWILRAYAVAAAYGVALALIVGVVLAWRGDLTRERARAAFQALRGRTPVPEPAPGKKPADGIAEREEILQKKTQELGKLDELAARRLAMIRAEEAALARRRDESAAAAAEARKAREEYDLARSDAELAADVPIFSRMEPAGIVAMLKGGDDARFVRTLRALRPGKAADVLESLMTDPQFEEAFRRVPADAPTGTKSRAERITEEFRKAP